MGELRIPVMVYNGLFRYINDSGTIIEHAEKEKSKSIGFGIGNKAVKISPDKTFYYITTKRSGNVCVIKIPKVYNSNDCKVCTVLEKTDGLYRVYKLSNNSVVNITTDEYNKLFEECNISNIEFENINEALKYLGIETSESSGTKVDETVEKNETTSSSDSVSTVENLVRYNCDDYINAVTKFDVDYYVISTMKTGCRHYFNISLYDVLIRKAILKLGCNLYGTLGSNKIAYTAYLTRADGGVMTAIVEMNYETQELCIEIHCTPENNRELTDKELAKEYNTWRQENKYVKER